jgi:pyruvate dehydrogenase E2 component (dihydrolipoamide acetyltransferase)
MPIYFSMPKLGLNMTEGVIVRWLLGEGEKVQPGRPVLEIETDKATQELEAPGEGILAKILAQPGETVPCNNIVAVILAAGETMPAAIPTTISDIPGLQKSELAVSHESIEAMRPAESAGEHERVNISPVARALAEELSVDISTIPLRGGRIRREDVLAAYEAQKTHPVTTAPEPRPVLPSLRKKIADHMTLSAHTVARVGLTLEADAQHLVEWRKRLQANNHEISYNVLLAKITARALREFPYVNSQWINDEVILMPEINIGIAVETERGLVAPVLKGVDGKNVETLQEEFNAASQRALNGRSTVADLEGGTFTITNLGSFEIESFLPIVNVPECAILAVGAIQKKPAVNAEGDGILIRPRISLTLAFDHRLVDGAPAAKFLQRLKHLLEGGETG